MAYLNQTTWTRFSLRGLLVAVAICGLALTATKGIMSYAITDDESARIYVGLHRTDLVRIAGEPHHVDGEYWIYRCWNDAVPERNMLFFCFNSEDQVESVDFCLEPYPDRFFNFLNQINAAIN